MSAGGRKSRILFLAQLLPYPPVCGGTIRSFNILKRLCSNHDVTLLSFSRRPKDHDNAGFLSRFCSSVKTVPMVRSGFADARWAARSLLKRSSFIVDRDYVGEMRAEVDTVLSNIKFDLIYIDHLQMFQYVKDKNLCPKLLDEHNVEWKIIKRISQAEHGARKWFAAQEWPKLKRYELTACAECDAVSTVTEMDKTTLQAESSSLNNVRRIPIGVDPKEFRAVGPSKDSRNIISVATMSWPPNIDSMLHFCSNIYPLIKEQTPEARLIIAGSRPPSAVKRLERDSSISVPGFVDDVHELARNAAVFIVPLRAGSGMRVKILNAMSMGLPVVSTSVGCEGIEVTQGENALIADTPRGFADCVMTLLNNTQVRLEIGAAAQKFVVENHAWEVIYPRLDRLIESTIGSR